MSSRSLHILHAVQLYQPAPSGAARYFIEISRRFVQAGHRVTVIATDAFELEHLWAKGKRRIESPEDVYDGVRVLRFPVQRLPGPAILYPIVRRAMLELSRFPGTEPLLRRLAMLTPRQPSLYAYLRNSPDLADVDLVGTTNITLDFGILPFVAWAKQRNIPHVCTPFVHLGEPDNDKLVRYYSMRHQIELLKKSDAVVTMTSLERRFLAAKGVDDAKMRTVGVGIEPSEIQGGDGARFRAEHKINGPMVLSVGVAALDKGTIHVVQALQQLWKQGIDVTWVQIGPHMDHFSAFIEQLPAADRARMRILGFVSDEVKRDALAAADVMAMPSRTDSFGIVYMEAWCYKVPVVGARAGGVPDVINHGHDGLLVGFGAVDELSSTLQRLISDRAYAQQLGEAGYAKVQREMTWTHTFAKVQNLYEELTRSKR